VVPVRLLVETLEGDRLREADPAHRCRRDETEKMNKEYPRLCPFTGEGAGLVSGGDGCGQPGTAGLGGVDGVDGA
jgi:hypothetical protein